MKQNDLRPVVVKVGGSLYDLPDLGQRLRHWLDRLDTQRVVLVPGGGPTAQAVRTLDQWQQLGEEASHWLALRSLSVNAQLLSGILPSSQVVERPSDCPAVWHRHETAILDAYAFAREDEGQPASLPHSWDVTSDSIAARVANVLGASRLILLKSAPLPGGMDWAEAGRRGLVDAYFGEAVGRGTTEVQWVNFRET